MLNRVFNKMPKATAKKAKLSKATPLRVKLSQVDDIREMMDELSGVDYMLNESGFLEAYDQVQQAQDYLNYEFNASQVDGDLNALIENLQSIGVDPPQEVLDLQDQLAYIYEQANELGDLLNRLGGNIGGNTKW